MKVVHFQIQRTTVTRTAKELLQSIDSRAPIPQPIEKNRDHCRDHCVLDILKVDALRTFCKTSPDFSVATGLYPYDLEESTYRPDYYVRTQDHGPPLALR